MQSGLGNCFNGRTAGFDMTTIHDFELFDYLVTTGSMSETGRELGVSPAVVNRKIGALEERLGARLFYRPEARLELTASGRAFYASMIARRAAIRSGAPAGGNARGSSCRIIH